MSCASDQRWFAVGTSTSTDPVAAGGEAVTAALTGPDPKLIVVFCSGTLDPALVARGANAAAGGVPLIGASTAGEIATDRAGDAGVVATAIGGPGITAATAAVGTIDGRHREAGALVAGCAADLDPGVDRVLLLLPDGLSGAHQEIIRGAYSVLGAEVPLVGGCAGDGWRMRRTHQLHGEQVLTGGLVAAAIGSTAPLGIGVHHGWRKIGSPMMVTSGAGNRIFELDRVPALDTYLTCLNAPPAAYTDQAAFVEFATLHPLGLVRSSGQEEMRYISAADYEARQLVCLADLPANALVWLTDGDDGTILDATGAACREAVAALGGRQPLGLFAFDCVSRRAVLGDDGIMAELKEINAAACGAPVAGFYTYGEIARIRGSNGYHNQTLVVLAMS